MSLRFNFMSQVYGVFTRVRRVVSLIILTMDNKKGKDSVHTKKEGCSYYSDEFTGDIFIAGVL